MLYIKTIILIFSLLFSCISVIHIIDYFNSREDGKPIIIYISCVLWGIFYFLNNI